MTTPHVRSEYMTIGSLGAITPWINTMARFSLTGKSYSASERRRLMD